VAGLTAASCSGGENGGATTTVPTAEMATTTAAPTTTKASTVTTAPVGPNMNPDEIAVRNLVDMFEAEVTADYEAPDPSRPSLLALLGSPFKERLVEVITDFRNQGSFFKRTGGGLPPHRVNNVQFTSADQAVAFECLKDDRLTYKQGVEQPVDAAISNLAFKIYVERGVDGQWRITSMEKQTPSVTAGNCRGLKQSQ
jgi:hypothetical protein